MTDKQDDNPSPEAQRREAFGVFMASLDARDMPVSMAASFQAGWDACMRRMGAWRAESERQLRSWQDRCAAISGEPNSAVETAAKPTREELLELLSALPDFVHDFDGHVPGDHALRLAERAGIARDETAWDAVRRRVGLPEKANERRCTCPPPQSGGEGRAAWASVGTDANCPVHGIIAMQNKTSENG